MNKYVKNFLQRGIAFGGFGPITAGTVFLILHFTLADFALSGCQVFLAILSTYLLAFVQAGATVFNQIEEWALTKSLLCHFLTIYLAYSICYIANSWIPFEPMVLVIFTAIFVAAYFIIWFTVYFCIKAVSKKLNAKIN